MFILHDGARHDQQSVSFGRNQKKALIVDDEYLIRLFLRIVLEEEGYLVFDAETGREALDLFAEHKPEIVILDIRLPDVGGLTLLKNIKEIEPATTVIMATACVDAESRDFAARMGAFAYLEKPFHAEQLKRLVHRAGTESALRVSIRIQI